MRTAQAGLSGDVFQYLFQLGVRRVRRHVDDEDAAGKETAAPDVRAVVGEAEVVRLVAGRAEVKLLDDLAVFRRRRVYIDDGQEVVVLGIGIDAKHVEDLFRPVEAFHERRQTGFRSGAFALKTKQRDQANGEPAEHTVTPYAGRHGAAPHLASLWGTILSCLVLAEQDSHPAPRIRVFHQRRNRNRRQSALSVN